MSDLHPLETLTDLVGWKDVATYLGRSVRTVQRWEKELGLPVRRVRTQAGEVIYASRRDLDAWLASRQGETGAEREGNGGAEHAGNGEPRHESTEPARATTPPAAAPHAKRARVSPRWIWAGALLLGLAATVGVLSGWDWGVIARKAQPSSWSVEDGALAIRDSGGRLLWTHRFAFPLDAEVMGTRNIVYGDQPAPWVVLEDLDGDSTTEVLVVPFARQPGGHSQGASLLHCFEGDGRLRFVHEVRRSVRFGGEAFGPPFVSMPPLVVRRGGRAHLWAPSIHSPYFPSVLHKLTPTGEVVGEYWQAGYPTTLREVERGGRRFLLVGGTRNEDYSASLAVLDADDPTGTAPADDDRYRCRDCPRRAPAAFLSFPRLELGRLAATRAVTTKLQESPGQLLVHVAYLPANNPLGTCDAAALYHLDDRFRVASADLVDGYAHCHARLRIEGHLDHDFGPGDVAEMVPVRAWYDGVLEVIDRPSPATAGPAGAQQTPPTASR